MFTVRDQIEAIYDTQISINILLKYKSIKQPIIIFITCYWKKFDIYLDLLCLNNIMDYLNFGEWQVSTTESDRFKELNNDNDNDKRKLDINNNKKEENNNNNEYKNKRQKL